MVPGSIPGGRIWRRPMPYPLGHGASWLTPARQVASWLTPARQVGKQQQKFFSHFSFTGEVKQQGGPRASHPSKSCCPCPCSPDRGIWPGGVTVSTTDSEFGNRGSNPRRAFAETRFMKGGKAFRVYCCLWQRVRAARQAVNSPPSSVGRAQGP